MTPNELAREAREAVSAMRIKNKQVFICREVLTLIHELADALEASDRRAEEAERRYKEVNVIWEEILTALEARGYFHCGNGKEIGRILDEFAETQTQLGILRLKAEKLRPLVERLRDDDYDRDWLCDTAEALKDDLEALLAEAVKNNPTQVGTESGTVEPERKENSQETQENFGSGGRIRT